MLCSCSQTLSRCLAVTSCLVVKATFSLFNHPCSSKHIIIRLDPDQEAAHKTLKLIRLPTMLMCLLWVQGQHILSLKEMTRAATVQTEHVFIYYSNRTLGEYKLLPLCVCCYCWLSWAALINIFILEMDDVCNMKGVTHSCQMLTQRIYTNLRMFSASRCFQPKCSKNQLINVSEWISTTGVRPRSGRR